jgi:DNA-binding transcriptional LysR family regulator
MDLNLLTALDALLDERSVGAAADRLHLSQPAMSRTLARIRRATGDQILVRSGRSMLLTPYAEEIQNEVHQLVVRAQSVLAPAADLNIAAVERTFTVQFNDVIAGALLPRLSARAAAEAPGVRLRVLGEGDTADDDLRRGRTDLQVAGSSPESSDVRAVTVATDRLAVFGRPALPFDPATLEGFAALPHVVISRRGRQHDRIDHLLAESRSEPASGTEPRPGSDTKSAAEAGPGLRRRVVLTVPTLYAALRTVAAADLITVAPEAMARCQADLGTRPGAGSGAGPGLRIYALPLPVPEIPVVMAWHVRHERDAAHRWLRALVSEILVSLCS